MGIYYEWTDYQNKGLSETRIINMIKDKGMNIILDMDTNHKIVLDIVGSFKEIKEWSIKNLSDMWTTAFMQDNNNKIIVKVFFTNEEDAVAFKLRWL